MKRRLFQFRLRSLLLVMVIAGPISVWCEPHVRPWLTPPGDEPSFGFDYVVDPSAFDRYPPGAISVFDDSYGDPPPTHSLYYPAAKDHRRRNRDPAATPNLPGYGRTPESRQTSQN